jgi:hypothetical protein
MKTEMARILNAIEVYPAIPKQLVFGLNLLNAAKIWGIKDIEYDDGNFHWREKLM